MAQRSALQELDADSLAVLLSGTSVFRAVFMTCTRGTVLHSVAVMSLFSQQAVKAVLP